jgi:hypothetical protein
MQTKEIDDMTAAGKVASSSCLWVIGLVISIAVSCAPTRPISTESPLEARHREQRELQAKTEAAWKTYQRNKPPYTLSAKYDKFDNATSLTLRVDVSPSFTLIALTVYLGSRVSGPPADMSIICAMTPGGSETDGARLIFLVDGQRIEVGEMRYSPGVRSASYSRLGVLRTLMQDVAQGTSVEGRCGGRTFTLEAGHLEGLQKFLAGETGEPGG